MLENRKIIETREKKMQKRKNFALKTQKIIANFRNNPKNKTYFIKSERPLNFISNYVRLPYYTTVINHFDN